VKAQALQHVPRLDPTIIRDVIARVRVVHDISKLDAAAVIKMLCDSAISFAAELQDESCYGQLLDRLIDNEEALLQSLSEFERAYIDAAESPRARRWRIGIAVARRDPRSALVGFLTNLLLDALEASPETYAISKHASSRVH
jgi:hypothetical protein